MTRAPTQSTQDRPQYRVVIEIQAPIERCFAAGTAEDAMMYWVPGITRVVYDHGKAAHPYGPGSERLVTLKGGMSLVERVQISQPPHFLAYDLPSLGAVGDALLRNYRGHMHFEKLGEHRTRLTWLGFFDCPGAARLAQPLLRQTMKTAITTFAKRMKVYLER